MTTVIRGERLRETFGELGRHWGWLLALGIVFVVLGTIGLGMTFLLTLVNVLLFGLLIGIGGVLQVVHAFRARGWKAFLSHLLMGLLYVAAGIVIWGNPVGASLILTLVLAAAFVGSGILRLVIAFQHRQSRGRGWILFGGIIDIALGAIIAAHWPVSGLWVIGLFVAIELIVNGWSCILLALAARHVRPHQGALPGSQARA